MLRWPLAFLLLLAACDSDPAGPLSSADLATAEISLNTQLRSNGVLAQIIVTPLNEYNFVVLTGADALLFGPVGGPQQQLTPFQQAYFGQLDTNAVDFELVFARDAGTRIVSPLELPPAFGVSVPAGPVSRADPIPVTWDASQQPFRISLEVGGPCLTQRVVRFFETDVGSYAIQPADLFVQENAGDCDLDVVISRFGTAQLAPELSSTPPAQTLQVRTATVVTVP